jgi:dTDP-4-amino-4,6-dideoxygalactose transaminase
VKAPETKPERPPIPFNRSALQGRELEHIFRTMTIGQIAGDQTYSKKCHGLLEQVLGVKRALVTTSCTHALEMCALLLNIEPGDEVIVPTFTFVSTANAFALRGAKIVFADIRPDTLNLDEKRLESLVTPRTQAIVPVHYAGVGCEMERIMSIAAHYAVALVEDNAHGLFGKYRGRWLGTFGGLATQSFHETKNITCGEGGALLVNDERFVERAEILREKGTNRSRFFRGEIDKYSWVDVGSSYVISDVLAAFLYAQLEVWQSIQAQRQKIWHYYDDHLRDWSQEHGIRCPTVPPYCEQSFHMYYLLMPSLEQRQGLIGFLKSRGISSVFHYVPLHTSDMGRTFGARPGDCPVAEDLSDRLVRLPFYGTLEQADQERVVQAVKEYVEGPTPAREWRAMPVPAGSRSDTRHLPLTVGDSVSVVVGEAK